MTDVLVIGAGVNGLTAAAVLARAGKKVLVLEKRSDPGGIASSYELAPGFRASVGPDHCGLLLPSVVSELELSRHGLELLASDPSTFVPTREGQGLLLWTDAGKSAEEIRKFSVVDAQVYPRFLEQVETLTGFLRPLLSKPAPTPAIESGADLLELLRHGFRFRQLGARAMHDLLRILPMALEDYLNEWFESDATKAAVAADVLEGVGLGPRSAGTSALFLYHRLGARKLARGGTGAVAQALVRSVESRGGVVRTSSPVSRILVENGRASGVELESGERLAAGVVLSTLAPRTTFHGLTGASHLPTSYLSEINNIRYRGVTAKLNLALAELPDFRCRPGREPRPHHRGLIQIGESLEDLERAYDASKYGRFSERPVLWMTIPSLADPSLAPEGKHVASVIAQFAPYHLREQSWTEASERLTAAILDRLSEAAPNVNAAVLHRDLWTPDRYERELGLPEGSWHQGEMALDQMLFMRPVPGWSRYETPIEELYLGGAATHPGGGISGACGYNAAHRVLKTRG